MIITFKKNSLIIFLSIVIFSISFFNKNLQTTGDSLGTLLTSQAIIETQSIKLDGYNTDMMSWQLIEHNKSKYYYFPLGSSISSIPFVYIANTFFNFDMSLMDDDTLLQKVITSILSIFIFYLLFKIALLYFDDKIAAILALAFWMGTSFSSTLCSALWSQSFASIYSLAAIYLTLLITKENKDHLWVYLAIMLFMAYLSRPTMSLLSVTVVLFLFFSHKKLISIKVTLLVFTFLAFFVLFSFYEYNQILPPYYFPKRLNSEIFWTAFYGNLLSPARGILIFSPFLFLFLLNLDRTVTLFNKKRVLLFFAGWVLLHLIIISKFPQWWGGGSYGPRFMIDVLAPIFLLFVLLLKDILQTKGFRCKVNILFLTFSFLLAMWINSYQGLFNKYTIQWFLNPNIDKYPHYLFDWKYPQFLHNQKRHMERLEEFQRNEKFLKVYQGSHLPTQIGKKLNTSMIITEKEERSGFLTFGPYVKLFRGNYKFEIVYKSSKTSKEIIGYWDIHTNLNTQKILQKENLYGTDNNKVTISNNFTLNNDTAVDLEIRTFYAGSGDLTIEELRIEKIDE